MKILTSLAENHYFYGLAALLNSVVRQDLEFFDRAVIGYRGELPPWLPPLETSKHGKMFKIKPGGPIVEFVRMDHSIHMVHEKPRWFLHLSQELYPEAEEYYFFDSDIVVLQRLTFFSEWLRHGVALCEDVNFDMANDHPIRRQWAAYAMDTGLEIRHQRSRYYNSGFIGWTKSTAGFLEDWVQCLEILSPHCGTMKEFRSLDRSYPVLSANQDSLNLATMVSEFPISTMGPEAMGFTYGLRLMAHPLGADAKPWKRRYLRSFLAGKPPSLSDLEFWQTVNGEAFAPFSAVTVQFKFQICRLLRFLSRFYGGKSTSNP